MEAKVSSEHSFKKAQLLVGGTVRIPKDLRLPFKLSRSTAGPGAGHATLVFSFGGTRAKKTVSREEGEFELVTADSGFKLLRDGDVFLEDVNIVPTLLHAPYQAFVNIESSCVFDCKFCNSPVLPQNATKNLTDDKIVEMVIEASKAPDFESVAFTSAVPTDRTTTVKRMATLVARIRELLPDVPIGVEPYATRPDEIEMLKDAGADEMKINIESFDRDIFERVCGKMDFDQILHALNHSGEVFGRNRVCSNIIFGLGESDDNVLEGVAVLANMGVVAALRALRTDELNAQRLREAIGDVEPVSAERMIRLAKEQKTILMRYGLSPLEFKTMCHSCLSCDIVPFWDV